MNIIKPYRFYQKAEIQRQAETILSNIQGKRRRPLKNYDVSEAVADYLDLYVEWTSIEPDNQGTIAAMIIPVERKILINEDLPILRDSEYSKTSKEGFKNSTMAHEIGHWVLHVNQEAVTQYKDRLEDINLLSIEPFLCRTLTSTKGIEWQAQYFASCLLMPVNRLLEAKKGRDLKNLRHLYAIADELGVTLSNLKNRLLNIEWIYYNKNSPKIYPGKNLPNL